MPIGDYALNRYYDPARGRFTTPDPAASGDISRPSSWNRYAYTEGDPVNFNDPEGLFIANPWYQTGQNWMSFFLFWGGPRTVPRPLPLDPLGERGWAAKVDSKTNTWARSILSDRFISFQGSNCDKVFAGVDKSYTSGGFMSEAQNVNFYAAAKAPYSNWSQDDVSGNGDSTTSLVASLGNSTAATITNGIVPAILIGSGSLKGNVDVKITGDTLLHELLHAYTGWDDTTIYSKFSQSGLVDPKDGFTSAISRWIGTDCKNTPADPAP